jgi:uncharacterized repeat protein (TIGR02543 family)
MTASVSPEEAGIVNPPQGTYLNGKEISVVTEPSSGEWEFTGWTGDTTASDDSLTFTITRDMDLVANYETSSAPQYVLSTSTQPTEAGSVDPSGGTFTQGTTIDVQAQPASGWEFVEWTEDTSATGNPLTLTMNKDYNLTANFNQVASSFMNQVSVTDGDDTVDRFFGMQSGATAGFDDNIDRDLPPPPPDGFHAHFNIPDYSLAEDYRAISESRTVWELDFQPDAGQTITLNWDFSNTEHMGSLTLTDDLQNPSIQIDMKSQNSYQVSDTSVQILYIISN